MPTYTEQVEQLRWKKFPVLDDGFVCLVDIMGDDQAVVQAARVSYGKGTRAVSDDRTLIRYLMRHQHTTPLEMVELKFLVRVPMDCWRQWIRHRTASVNEYSTRYSLAIDSAQTTDETEWRRQSTKNRQGSDEQIEAGIDAELTRREGELQALAREVYEERIAAGVAREQARKNLPLSTYAEAYWKIDLHNLLHFLRLRTDGHAQKEIRDFAATIDEKIVAVWCPVTWEAFLDYRVNSLQLSALETKVIGLVVSGKPTEAIAELEANGLIPKTRELRGHSKNRERNELETKMEMLSIAVPWLDR